MKRSGYQRGQATAPPSGASVAYNEFYAWTDAHAPIDVSAGAVINPMFDELGNASEHVTFNPATGDITVAPGAYSIALSADFDAAAAGGNMTVSSAFKNINGVPDGNTMRAEGVRFFEEATAISVVAFVPAADVTYAEVVITKLA